METVSRERPVLQSALALVTAIGLGGGGLLAGFVLLLAFVGVLTIGAGFRLSPLSLIVLSLFFVQGIGCAGVALAYLKFRPRIAPKVRDFFGTSGGSTRLAFGAAVPGLRDLLVVGLGYVSALGAAVVGSIVVATLNVEPGQNAAAEIGGRNPEILLLLIPASVLVIGPGEELLFRGVVQGRLREAFGWRVAVVVASVVFAALHWFALTGGSATGNFVVLGILTGPALVFGLAYEYTQNIVVPSLIHGVYNATLFAGFYLSIAYGGEDLPAILLAL
jgi:hypothetical protein